MLSMVKSATRTFSDQSLEKIKVYSEVNRVSCLTSRKYRNMTCKYKGLGKSPYRGLVVLTIWQA